MTAYGRAAMRDLLLLSLAAGSADAAGFMGLGHIFTSNMTGNVVLLGIALGQSQVMEALHVFYVLFIFMTGNGLGTWMSRHIDEKDWSLLVLRVICCEAVLLFVFAVAWFVLSGEARVAYAHYLIIPLTLAMGLQASAMNQLSVPGAATTAVTGTLSSLVSGTIKMVAPSSSSAPTSRSRVGFQALVVCFYGGGAILSGMLLIHSPRLTGFVPAALVLVVTLCHIQALRAAKS